MSVSIRHRYHYGNVLINDEKVITGDAITGNAIPALRKNGSLRYMPFGGVIDEDCVFGNAIPVKLVNLTCFWWNDIGMGSDGYEIPLNHAVKGYLFHGKYYVAIRNDQPLHWEIQRPTTNYHTENVVSIR
ncbi:MULTISPECIES: hypothetical protein [Vibrio]|uniref:hypothetical protein n=1 Tax=Vibrio TaxID=662 RepID=UPI00207602E7|nr:MULTISPECIES: hypothetical protein [Vibrio]USD35550.1 hypothetical protein J8Z27_22320 [Vibrio sp. SCSIO 43186]USD72674.1 hypothetical protein J4N41_22335 [Vibrio sp. SCSIO 43139]